MIAPLRKLLIIIPFTLLASSFCWAQTGAIEGDVKGLDGKPLVGAEIKITRTDVKGNYHVKTDKKGHYYYGGLPLGKFNIEVDVDGKMMDGTEGVPTKIMTSVEVSFDLKASAAKNGGLPGGGGAAAEEPARNMSPAQKAQMEKERKDQEEKMAKNKELNDAFNAGKEAVTNKNWDGAIDAFNKATTLAPTEHVVWANLADAYVSRSATKTGADQQADLDKAVEGYQKAIALKPDDPAYHNNYALTLGKEKKFDDAQVELTKAAQLDAANAGKYYYNLGAVYVNTGQMEPAGVAFKKAMELQPDYADSYYQYGIYLMGKATTDASGKIIPPAGTEDAFNKYLQLAPNGQFADAAKAMLQSVGATVQTNFSKTPAQTNTTKKK